MSIEVSAVVAILVFAIVTYITRAGGMVLVSRITFTKRFEQSLGALAGSVLVAIIVPAAVTGDLAAQLATATSIITMLRTRSAVTAAGAGMVVAICTRLVG